MFKIPWKHHSCNTWSEEDSLLLKDWAITTGRYKQGSSKNEWPVWKMRLRCALNKSAAIKEVRSMNRLNVPKPYKVYRFVSPNENLWISNTQKYIGLIFDDRSAYSDQSKVSVYQPRTGNIYTLGEGSSSFGTQRQENCDDDSVFDDLALFSEESSSNKTSRLGEFIKRPPRSTLSASLCKVTFLNEEPENHQVAFRILHLDKKIRDAIITNISGCCLYTFFIEHGVRNKFVLYHF
ncbi:Interferon regulatory factor 4 [Cichlidogyrus casuarinus]|uniref:Interferon regulatory factor 4 n=1 Tax=Cichlidogyrus casuarinus TaxID=1844966 RepID=A0ABD2QG39_9PLAT